MSIPSGAQAPTVNGTETSSVAIYCRLSLDREQSGLGVARQEAECRDYAAKRGWGVADLYVDNDISATSGKRRPEFERLLADRPEAVLVWNLDRLVRVSKDLERVLDLGVNVYAIQAGQLDLSTPAGRAVARTVTAWSTYEGEIRTARQLAAYRQRAERGVPNWGRVTPFGYNADGTVDRERAALVQEAARDIIRGTLVTEIARRWRDLGIDTASGTQWTGALVKSIVRSPRNAGFRTYRRQVVGQGSWEPILDEATWRGVNAVLQQRTRDRGHGKGGHEIANLLTNIATCAKCGGNLKAVTGRQYACAAYHSHTPIEWLDSVVLHELRDALNADPQAWAGQDSGDVAEEVSRLQAEVAEVEGKLAELAEAYAMGVLTMAQMKVATEKLRERSEVARKGIAGAGASFSVGELIGDLEAFFEAADSLDLGQLRTVIKAVFSDIVVAGRGKGYRTLRRDLVTFTRRAA